MPDPTARITRKPRMSFLALLAIFASIAVAGAGVYFFTIHSKEWIAFAGCMCLAVALMIYGVVETAAHDRDMRRWREYQDAYDEVVNPPDDWWGDDEDDDSETAEDSTHQEHEDEPDTSVSQSKWSGSSLGDVVHPYTPLDVLEAKKVSREKEPETPSTSDTMPGAGKKSIPPVTGAGSMPTPGAVTIPHIDDDDSDHEDEPKVGAHAVPLSAKEDTATRVDTPAVKAEDDAETRVDTPAVKAVEDGEPVLVDFDWDDKESTAEDTATVEDTTTAEATATAEATDEATAETAAEDDKESTAEDTAETAAEDDKESAAEATDEAADEAAAEDTATETKDTPTAESTDTAPAVKGSGFNLLGFGKQDKE